MLVDKPKKKDFADMREFLRASAAWAEQYNIWPWGGPKDEDDDYYFVAVDEPATAQPTPAVME